VRLFHAVHAAGRTTPDEYLAEEAAPFLVFQPVDGEYLLAVHVSQSENGLDAVEPLLELALVEQHHHIGVVDDGFLTISLPMMSCISCVTTPPRPRTFLRSCVG